MNVVLVLLGIVALLLITFVAMYNGLVKVRTMVEEGWSGIDVQLKRRANLIPNLVESVKGYMAHEKTLLNDVTRLRAKSLEASGVGEQAKIERDLSRAISGIFAVAENYPDLKANENFVHLQSQLADIEEQIQLARRYYNGTVRNLNIKVDSFPSNIVAGMFGFTKAEFFEIESPEDRAVPKVQF